MGAKLISIPSVNPRPLYRLDDESSWPTGVFNQLILPADVFNFTGLVWGNEDGTVICRVNGGIARFAHYDPATDLWTLKDTGLVKHQGNLNYMVHGVNGYTVSVGKYAAAYEDTLGAWVDLDRPNTDIEPHIVFVNDIKDFWVCCSTTGSPEGEQLWRYTASGWGSNYYAQVLSDTGLPDLDGFHSAFGWAHDDMYFGCRNGTTGYLIYWNGTNFSIKQSWGGSYRPQGIWGTANDNIWIFLNQPSTSGGRLQLIHYNGSTWTDQLGGALPRSGWDFQGHRHIIGHGSGPTIYAVGGGTTGNPHGQGVRIWRTIDGTNWVELNNPVGWPASSSAYSNGEALQFFSSVPEFDNFDPPNDAVDVAPSKIASFDVTAPAGIDVTATLITVNGVLAYENETELNGFSIVRSAIASGYHYEITPPDGWANGSNVVIDLAAKDTASTLAVGGWSFNVISSLDCFRGPLNATEEALLSPFASLDYNERLRQSLLLASVTRPDSTTAARVIFLRGHSQELAPVLREMVPTPTAAEQASRLCYRATNLQVSNALRRKVNLLPGAIRELQGLGLPRQHAELLNAYEREDQPNTEAPLASLIVLLAKALV